MHSLEETFDFANQSCVLIHGFTGQPNELQPLTVKLHQIGYHVVTPTLAGHDGTYSSLRGVRCEDWIESVALPIRDTLQHKPVHLIGFSMGALIAAILATELPVTSVTMLSPAVFFAKPVLLWRQVEVFLKGHLRPDSREGAYLRLRPSGFLLTPPSSVGQLNSVVKLAKQRLDQLTVPTCIIQGVNDEIVDPASSDYVYTHIASAHREVHMMPRSRHHVCLDEDADTVIDIVTNFLHSESVRQRLTVQP